MGLGLSIVERIVRSTGGFVKMKTAVGRGTTFAVWLPEEEIGQEHGGK
jgi:signal transduction histidine kinase